jgi:hypothetical protein
LAPALPPAAAETAVTAPPTAVVSVASGVSGVNPDDQMDELELEPLVDFGMAGFDW